MRKRAFFGIILISLLWVQAFAQSPEEEKLFQDAKLLLFDEKWERAQDKLEELIKEYPQSPLFCQAVFYRAKCLGKQRDEQAEAIAAHENYLRCRDKNPSLVEEAETSIIELAYELYERGERSYLGKIEERLQSLNRVVKYYAAFKLSLAKDKQAASRAIPVLKQIIEHEEDADFRDRAKIALLRISPDSLKDVGREEEREAVRILKIRVYSKGKKEASLSLNIPWALADLALRAIPEKQKDALRAKGYDLDKLIDQLTRSKAGIEISDEDGVLKIWIEKD